MNQTRFLNFHFLWKIENFSTTKRTLRYYECRKNIENLWVSENIEDIENLDKFLFSIFVIEM